MEALYVPCGDAFHMPSMWALSHLLHTNRTEQNRTEKSYSQVTQKDDGVSFPNLLAEVAFPLLGM